MYLGECLIVEIEKQPGLVQVTGICPKCSEQWHLTLLKEKVLRYAETKKKVQDIFPDLPEDMRELLQSGICSSCWNKFFPENKDENSQKKSDLV